MLIVKFYALHDQYNKSLQIFNKYYYYKILYRFT